MLNYSPSFGGFCDRNTIPNSAAYFPMGPFSTIHQQPALTPVENLPYSFGFTQPNTPDLLMHRQQVSGKHSVWFFIVKMNNGKCLKNQESKFLVNCLETIFNPPKQKILCLKDTFHAYNNLLFKKSSHLCFRFFET